MALEPCDHMRNAGGSPIQHRTRDRIQAGSPAAVLPLGQQHSVNRVTAIGYDRDAPNQFVTCITKSDNSPHDRAPTARLPQADPRMSPG